MKYRYRTRNHTGTVTVYGKEYYYEVEVETSEGYAASWTDPGDPGGLEGIIAITAIRDDKTQRRFEVTASTHARLCRMLHADIAERAYEAMVEARAYAYDFD